MAKAVIIDQKQGILKRISQVDFPLTSIRYRAPRVKIENTIPFRVKFTNIGVPGYGPNNPAPIGIAVIGYNNYIL